MKNTQKNQIPPTLVVSSDKYACFWPSFFQAFFRWFPQAPKVYLCAETKKYDDARVVNLNSFLEEKGPASWSENFYSALKKIEEEYVLTVLDDFIITKRVDAALLTNLYKYLLKEKNCMCLRLVPIPEPTVNFKNSLLGEHVKNTPYRVSTQAAIWNKEMLKKLIVKGENPWQFEEGGTKRSESMEGIVLAVQKGLDKYPIQYSNAIIRGKMTLKSYNLCMDMGIDVDKNSIRVNSRWEDYYWLNASIFERHIMDFIKCRFSFVTNL